MDSVRIDIAGAQQVGLRFDQFPDALYAELREEIDALSNELYSRVLATTPDATGRLQSQERLRLFTDPARITGYVDIEGSGSGSGSDFAKAGALEYGSKGRPTGVGAHAMALDHFWANKLAAPIQVLVDAYQRTPNIEEFAFERGPLAAMQPEVVGRLNAIVERAVTGANA